MQKLNSKQKKMMKKKILLFLVCTVPFSCNNSEIIPVIDLNNIKHSINLDITDILKDITMVQISSDFLLSLDDKVYVTSRYLILYVNRESLHLFSRDGKHIRKLAERGNGPGEFYSIIDFFVDEEERILYYLDNFPQTRLNRIDINSGVTLEPLEIDFSTLTINYINGKIYSLPKFIWRGRTPFYPAGGYPDSAIVASSTSLPSGEITKYQGQHNYSFLAVGSSITSYYDEIVLMNLGYSDTLFTLKDNKLSPLCILRLSDKMTNTDTDEKGSECRIISAYKNGIILSKINYVTRPRLLMEGREFFALYDRKGNIYKIDNINVMNTKISNVNLIDPEKTWQLSSLLPIICGKYGYMLVEYDFFEHRPPNSDPNNDNPIIIVGEVKYN